jgi:hypothetical protein
LSRLVAVRIRCSSGIARFAGRLSDMDMVV